MILSATEFETIVSCAPLLLRRTDSTTGCDWFNEAWLAFRGRTLEQERGGGWVEGIHPDDVERCLGSYLEAFARRAPYEIEFRLRRHDGSWRSVIDRGAPYHDAVGRFAGYVAASLDVTERIESEASRLRQQRAEVDRLRALLPMCVRCKRPRDDRSYWIEVESYIDSHAAEAPTPGICRECGVEIFELV